MVRLDRRLEEIAALVRPGRRVADIGADHGFLVVSLVERGISPGGIACDINPMPLEKSRRTVAQAGLEGCIDLRLGDGLAPVGPEEAEEIVIAGMGGDLIARLVEETPWLRDGEKHLVLQPMTKADHLRRRLGALGFWTEEERAVESGAFVYTVFSVRYTGQEREPDDLECFIGKVLLGNSPDTGRYLARTESQLRQRALGLEQSRQGPGEAERFHRLAERVKELEREWEDGNRSSNL